MIYHSLVTEVGPQICEAQLGFEERSKILDGGHFFREKFYSKANQISQDFTCSEMDETPHGSDWLETELSRSRKMWTIYYKNDMGLPLIG